MPDKYAHLEALRTDARDEIKRRIEQRDKYAIQLTIAMTALVGVAVTRPGLERVLIATPIVTIYFTILILYSYRIHKLLAKYLKEVIEPDLAAAAGTPPGNEWEKYYSTKTVPGIRRSFFTFAPAVLTIGSLIYLYSMTSDGAFEWAIRVVGVLYLVVFVIVLIKWYPEEK